MIVEKHSRMPRKASRATHILPASTREQKHLPVPLEQRTAILEDAKTSILAGNTLDQIAVSHGITVQTLSAWLHALGDEYIELRQRWVDSMLMEVEHRIRSAPDALELARARELRMRAEWYAERRDRDRYGDKVEVSGGISPIFSVTIVAAEPQRSAPSALIESDAHKDATST